MYHGYCMARYKKVGVNDRGYRVGEYHHRSKLSDRDVFFVIELREVYRVPIKEIAEKFECSKELIYKICNYQRRTELAVKWKRVPLKEEENPDV